jgi:hypothetical protein
VSRFIDFLVRLNDNRRLMAFVYYAGQCIMAATAIAGYVLGWEIVKHLAPVEPGKEWFAFLVWTVLYGLVMFPVVKSAWELHRYGQTSGYFTSIRVGGVEAPPLKKPPRWLIWVGLALPVVYVLWPVLKRLFFP